MAIRYSNRYKLLYFGGSVWFWFGNYEDDSDDEVFYGTYEEAELECLKKLIEIVKRK